MIDQGNLVWVPVNNSFSHIRCISDSLRCLSGYWLQVSTIDVQLLLVLMDGFSNFFDQNNVFVNPIQGLS